MLKNYFTTAIRNLVRHKLYSFINIGGLTIGLAACLLIFLFVRNELSYDKTLPNHDRIVRMEAVFNNPGQDNNSIAYAPGAIALPLTMAFPGSIETSTRMYPEEFLVEHGDVKDVENFWMVDPTFFEVFDFEIVAGNRANTFSDFTSVTITESIAEKYFGTEPAVGKVLSLGAGQPLLKVAAVMKELPENTHLNIDVLMQFSEQSVAGQPWVAQWWVSPYLYTYLKLTDISEVASLQAGFPAWFDKNAVPGNQITAGQTASEFMSFRYVPLADIHLHSTGKFQMKPPGDIMVVYSFTVIAFLILVIAIINFTNLSTARASLRSKEIALRKVVGASRRQLIGQFLGEALLTTTIALLLAFTIVEIGLPWVIDFLGTSLSFDDFRDPAVLAGLAAVVAVIGLSAGAYPSLKLSAYRPAHVLHSSSAAVVGSTKVRGALTMLQFTIAIGLMITTAVIYGQINYARDIDAGFDKTDRIALENMTYGPVREVAGTIKQEIASLPGVKKVAFSRRPLPVRGVWGFPVRRHNSGATQSLKLEPFMVDFDTLQFFGAELVAGRLFSEDRQGDLVREATAGNNEQQTTVLNETAVSYLGFDSAKEAVGQTIQKIQSRTGGFIDVRIIGVVKDMHLRSVRDKIEPNMFTLQRSHLQILNVHLEERNQASTLLAIEEIWKKLAPIVPVNQSFVSEGFDSYYEADEKRGQMFAGFSLFAILVSCLGLYGLASFTAERRIKEIGVRKVMGARVRDIVALLTFQFSKPVLFANIVAWPIAWFVADSWLEGFVYRIDLSPVYFITAGAAALLIACLTVAGHAFRTARANPIAALKYE